MESLETAGALLACSIAHWPQLGRLLLPSKQRPSPSPTFRAASASPTRGIAFSYFLCPFLRHALLVVYGLRAGLPFLSFANSLLLGLQEALLVFWLFSATKQLNTVFLVACFFFFGGVYLSFTPAIELTLLQYIHVLLLLLFFLSRIRQLWTNFKHKSTGQLSLYSCLLVCLSHLVPLFIAQPDLNYPLSVEQTVAISVALEVCILLQFWIYRPAKLE